MKTNKMISIYDTTLRDGAQTLGVSFSLHDKIRIAQALDKLHIDYIEGGWPGSNPKDIEFFEQIHNYKLTHSKIAAFGSTKRKNTTVHDDEFLQALVQSRADVITLVAKGWDFQVEKVLGVTLEENIDLIKDTIEYLKEKGFTVFLDSEHFFDGFKENSEYSLKTIQAAESAGADMVILCDTNGGTLPHEINEITAKAFSKIKTPLGIHCHNDAGVAIANSIAGILAGIVSVQGTINGLGERCGNCDLISMIANIYLKMGYHCNAAEKLHLLTETSHFVSETANMVHDSKLPFVGEQAFAHKGGIHVAAIKKDTKTYEHISPSVVGNKRQVLISELSGRGNIEFKMKELGIELPPNLAKPILDKIKKLEEYGYHFEAADASLELMLKNETGDYKPFFETKSLRVTTYTSEANSFQCEATVIVDVNGETEHTASLGNGPVEALDKAIRKALVKFYPILNELQLSDYKVRVLSSKEGTGAQVRVLIDQRIENMYWTTIGVSTNIIEASWLALTDGIEYLLYKKQQTK